MKFGDYLAFLRKSKRLTARELGEKVGTTGQYITQTEQGKLKAPNRNMAHKLALALDVKPVELWGIAALERFDAWCIKEGIDQESAQTFFQAARYDKKMAAQKKGPPF